MRGRVPGRIQVGHSCQDVSLRNHPRQPHWVLQRQRVKRGAEAYSIGALSGGGKHRQRIGRDGKLLKEMMIDHRIDIKTGVVRMFDLAHDFPDHVVVRLSRWSLNFAINTKAHAWPLMAVLVK
jgi:hypothetical protein